MRVILGIVLLAAPIAAHPSTDARGALSDAEGQNPAGVLGPVNALGQEVERPPAPTAPAPRLPDGTIDLGDGIWISQPYKPEVGPRQAEPLLLPSVAAAVIGGTSIFGGRGGYVGTIVGALILRVITTMLTMLQIPEGARMMIFGAIVLFVTAAYLRIIEDR